MKFARDLLLIDLKTTGPDFHKDLPLQLSAVLLDKDNLLEKSYFNSYIKHYFSQSTNDRIVQILGINKDIWMASPNLKTVLTKFQEQFPFNVIISSHNITNVNFLREAFHRANLSYEYDYHILELWSLGFFFLAKQNIKKVPTAETLGSYFKLRLENPNDALSTSRYLAEILRKLAKGL